ncbi:MAG: quinone-dependent dihydroorotate dehydrogenase [Oligoflexia bacterium]|nr:quinone-dependent dihydroorotate dehydrogenase [Oligoflexia bacterium]
MQLYRNLIRPIFFKFDAENIHNFIVKSAKIISPLLYTYLYLCKFKNHGSYEGRFGPQNILGLNFKNPIGLAAGFDKNAEIIPFLSTLNFGFIETGSVTALPNRGNDRPRIFRLIKDEALINHMGLNNIGANEIANNLKKIRKIQNKFSIPLPPIGVNIAKTPSLNSLKISAEEGILDIVTSFKLLYIYADYLTLNISCPNTSEGKVYEELYFLSSLLKTLKSESILLSNLESESIPKPKQKPIFLKISADLNFKTLDQILDLAIDQSLSNINGFVVCNTTKIDGKGCGPSGGLSGLPLQKTSTNFVQHVYKYTEGKFPIIASGGVNSYRSYMEKIDAGASLVQIFTSFIYEGPFVVNKILNVNAK